MGGARADRINYGSMRPKLRSVVGSSCRAALDAARTIFMPVVAQRPSPACDIAEKTMASAQRRQAAALMRVNHCGEVCAQALYQGQALFARDAKIKSAMHEAASEEIDHLAWTAERINELDGRQSLLNPLWYAGSLAIGAAASLISDKVSLGFVAETEKQVAAHLQSHLEKLPVQDLKSRAIVAKMDEDERQHATNALAMGGAELPVPARRLMASLGRIMTTISFWL